MSTDKQPDVHPLVGLPHGHVDANGETIVYEYDEAGNFVGWHKLPAEETE